jgi:hypothetical protein
MTGKALRRPPARAAPARRRRARPAWARQLSHDPLPALIASPNPCLAYAVRRDLLDEDPGPVRALWALPEAQRLLRRQLPDGSWPYPGGGVPRNRDVEDYAQIETYRTLGILVEKFAATRRLAALEGAAEFMFSRQAAAGDFRGIYGRQYTPNYTAGILELLVKAGYARDPRAGRALSWLLGLRQDDGGWAIPMLTRLGRWDQPSLSRPALAPDRTRPASHMVTGVVLRAFAAHPRWRRSSAARHAADLLAGRLFGRDAYPGRDAPSFWLGFGFPFWFTDLLSALDSMTQVGADLRHPRIAEAYAWFARHQSADGTWRLHATRGRDPDTALWISLAICRVFRRRVVPGG